MVMLSQVENPEELTPNNKIEKSRWDAYFFFDDAAKLFSEFKSKGADIFYEPVIKEEYSLKEFAVKDIDGYVLAFGQDLDMHD